MQRDSALRILMLISYVSMQIQSSLILISMKDSMKQISLSRAIIQKSLPLFLISAHSRSYGDKQTMNQLLSLRISQFPSLKSRQSAQRKIPLNLYSMVWLIWFLRHKVLLTRFLKLLAILLTSLVPAEQILTHGAIESLHRYL